MKKSELRKVIREVINEQLGGGELTSTSINYDGSFNPPTQFVSPVLKKSGGWSGGNSYLVKCPSGYKFHNPTQPELSADNLISNYTATTAGGTPATGFSIIYPQDWNVSNWAQDQGGPDYGGGSGPSDVYVKVPGCVKVQDKDFIGNPGKHKEPNPSPAKDVNVDLPTPPNIVNPGTVNPVRGVDTGTSGPYQVDN